MASVSRTSIGNLALSHIREKSVLENIETDKGASAQAVNLWYDPARRQALADYDFGFARKRLALAVHGDDPPAEWSKRYQWPSDCIQVRRIENPLGRQKPPVLLDIEQANDGTMSILTNQDEAVLIYTRDATTPAFFTPHFVLALSYLIAHFIAGPLTGKKSIQDQMIVSYNLAAGAGAAHEANVTARATEGAPDAPWILER